MKKEKDLLFDEETMFQLALEESKMIFEMEQRIQSEQSRLTASSAKSTFKFEDEETKVSMSDSKQLTKGFASKPMFYAKKQNNQLKGFISQIQFDNEETESLLQNSSDLKKTVSVALVLSTSNELRKQTIETFASCSDFSGLMYAHYDENKDKIILYINCEIWKTSELRQIKKLLTEIGFVNQILFTETPLVLND